MFDLPEHFKMGLTVDGQGPARDEDLDHYGCWCGDPDCDRWVGTWLE